MLPAELTNLVPSPHEVDLQSAAVRTHAHKSARASAQYLSSTFARYFVRVVLPPGCFTATYTSLTEWAAKYPAKYPTSIDHKHPDWLPLPTPTHPRGGRYYEGALRLPIVLSRRVATWITQYTTQDDSPIERVGAGAGFGTYRSIFAATS